MPTTKKKVRFNGLIGQEKAKRKLDFHLDNFDATNVLPHMLFIAPKGCGKTHFAKAVARNLMSAEPTYRQTINEFGDRTITEVPAGQAAKRFLEVNCSSIRSVPQLVEGLLLEKVINKEVTVLFDEASELPKDVSMWLLSAINPNENNFNSVDHQDMTLDFDFRRQTFMFATTEAHKLFHALVDRCDRVDLEEYTLDELGKIVMLNLENLKLKCDMTVLKEMSSILRGNARAAQKMANNIEMFHGAKGSFTSKLWEELRKTLGILPMGLNRIEVQVLRALAEVGECSLTNLAAKTGMTSDALRRDFEMYLQKMNMMQIDRSGRSITAKGREYLEVLDAA